MSELLVPFTAPSPPPKKKQQIEVKETAFVIYGHIITYRIVLHLCSEYGLSLTQNIIFSWDYLGKKELKH
jgi:hypothetical protein